MSKERRSDALLWFEEHGIERDETHVFDDASAHAAAPLVLFTLLTSDGLENGFERADLKDVGIGVFDRARGGVSVLLSPSLDYASGVVALNGTPAERLGRVQRNAFSGSYYLNDRYEVPPSYHFVLLEAYEGLEQTAGVDLRQRYLSIPRLREEVCERLGCSRDVFDDAFFALCQQNVGKLELSGAPLDSAAKDAALGIKQMERSDEGGLVTTSQSTQQVMSGVELWDKQYLPRGVRPRHHVRHGGFIDVPRIHN